MSVRILLADDESDITDPLAYALAREGLEVKTCRDGQQALEAAHQGSFDIVILDVRMPRLSGLDVCRTLRAESDVPIIMLTARDAEVDRVVGLEIGADDYVTKPFSTAELISRIRALIRRRALDRSPSSDGVIEAAGVTIDLLRHEITVDSQPVVLTSSEFKVLQLLAEQPGRLFSRQQIMEHLWQSPYVGDARACDVHISNLRRKIEADPAHPARIVTVRDGGYKLAAS